jgi:hypothetical protein
MWVDPDSSRVKRWLRIVVSLIAATLVWLVAGSARANAPLCDSRGATMFAPNPTLEEPNTSVDVGQVDDCAGAQANDAACHHGHGTTVTDSAAAEGARALLPAALTILPASPTDALSNAHEAPLPSRLDRDRVERPPR